MARLIVVSNRVALPDQKAPSGGLAVGVLAALKGAEGGIWFGWSGKTHETPPLEPVVMEHEGIQFMTVDLPTTSFNAYYDGFCNSSLWPLHHYFPGAFRYDATEYDAYLAINHHYASGLIEIVKNDDLVCPIRYLNKDFSHQTLSGFLRIADVAVVTPVRDGMNLVAKEFVAAQDPESPGVLVLSSLAGAAQELSGGALLVNPYDKVAVAQALNQALAMPLEERRNRHALMLAALHKNSIARWHETFIAALKHTSPLHRGR